jgi:sporadic carbohydrate cluster protein (TIGR04323 family)
MKIQKHKKGFRGYIFSRKINGNFIPQRVQNLVIREFANRKDIMFKLSSTEYNMKNSYIMLNSLLDDYIFIEGVIFYSIEQLLDDKKICLKIIKFLLNKKKIIFFALEELKISNISEFEKLNEILFIKKNSMNKKSFSKISNKLKLS